MGLFGFRKNSEKGSTTAAGQSEILTERNPDGEMDEKESYDARNKRRFFFLVEQMYILKGGTVVSGFVHGTVDLGDEVYVLRPHGEAVRAKVRGMDAEIESYRMEIQTATDMPVNLFLDANPTDFVRFTVITSIKPQMQTDVHEAVENPLVSALLYERKFFSNPEYYDLLCYAVAHGNYVTPVWFSEQSGEGNDGKVASEKDSRRSFCAFLDPRDKNKSLLPVYTDWIELAKWESAAGNEKAQTLIVSFRDICALIGSPAFSGFVVNPYSDNRYIMDKTVIQAIVTSEGYRREFGVHSE